MKRWILLATLALTTGCGFAPASYRAKAAQGDASALARLRDDMASSILTGSLQDTAIAHQRWANSPFEVIDQMSTWPIDATGTPAPLIDTGTTQVPAEGPWVQINTKGNEPWSVVTLYDARSARRILASQKWIAQEYRQPFDPQNRIYQKREEPFSDLALDIMSLAWCYFEVHQSYPADPADFFTLCGRGVVMAKERLMLADYDVEFVQDLSVQRIGLMLTPKRPGLKPILSNCGPDPAAGRNSGLWSQTLKPGESHGMQPWKKWDQVNIPRVDLEQVVATAGFALPSATAIGTTTATPESTGGTAPPSE